MHTIRLRGPWEYRLVAEPDSELRRIKLPTDLASVVDDDAVAVAFHRAFQKPTGLSDSDELDLVLENLPGAQVRLNDQDLVAASSEDTVCRFAIMPQLEQRNVLKIEITLSKGKPCDGEVRLEIMEG